MQRSGVVSLDELVSSIPDGAMLATPADYSGVAMAASRALIRRGVRDLHLLGVPTGGLQADLLIGAGCVRTVEAAAITLGEFGPAPRFTAAIRAGTIRMRDATCPAIHAALQAAEKGVPFMPLRGVLGSDILRHRPDWAVIDNPFAEGDPILVLPALRPDVALFHAPMADREGNVWIGRRRELVTLAHAARATLVTVERLHDGSLLEDEVLAPGTLPALYVTAIAEAPRGAWPLSFGDAYAADAAHLRDYVQAARSQEGFDRYLRQHVLHLPAAAEA